MSVPAPYLSLVVTARNDDHGGNLLGRMRIFAHGWIEQARRFNIPSELIIVEWNPPADKPRLAEALPWPADTGPCTVRIIEVPVELHMRYAHAEALPLYQMIAKNVGIRRARGRFIVATNIDILFSSELAQHLAKQPLEAGRMYRIDRYDAAGEVPVDAPVEQQLEYCRTHLIRVNAREGTFTVASDGRPTLSTGDIATPESGLLFGRGWMPVERHIANQPFRWVGQRAELLLERPPAGATALVIELEPGPGTGGESLDLEVAGDGHQVLARVTVDRRSRLRVPLPEKTPASLWFHVRRAGVPTPRDPRILNFRAYAFEWERAARGDTAASVRPVGGAGRLVSAWNALQHLINRLGKGGSLVTLTVPVSPRLRRTLKAYLDWNGVIGMARQAGTYFKRRKQFQFRTAPGSDIFPAGSGLLPGGGWRTLDEYRGEIFRRARSGAEIITTPGAPSGELALQVEPLTTGQAVAVELIDSAGHTLGAQRIGGLAVARFTVPRSPGRTAVWRLRWPESGELKVYWCGWQGAGSAAAAPAGFTQPWGAGWQWDAAAGAMAGGNSAELVVRTPEQGAGPLFLDLESAGRVQFELRDAAGAALARFGSEGRVVQRLDMALERGRTHVLDLSASGPFRARWCGWSPSPIPSTSDAAGAPVFLHTNACGDFTLMAREHWFDLRGYPEWDLFSMNIDSVFCIAAHHGGAREEMLEDPMRIYHVEHGSGSGWTPEGQARLFERIAARGLDFIDNEEVLIWAAQMNKLRSPMIFNHADWGMEGCHLRETCPAPQTVLPE